MEQIHNVKKRMPLILSVKDEKKWVNPQLTKTEILALIKPYQGEDLVAKPLSQTVNSPKNNRNTSEILQKVEYQELKILNLSFAQ